MILPHSIILQVVSLLDGCAFLTNLTNGMISCSLGDDGVATNGDTCSYTCNTGYVLSGDVIRTCKRNKRWSGSDPNCIGNVTT